MPRLTFRDVLGDAELPDGLEELFEELERSGWYPRGRMGRSGIRFWPDNGRPRQITITTDYPLNEHKLDEYRLHTGLSLPVEVREVETVQESSEGGK